jgi:hypothetical protein
MSKVHGVDVRVHNQVSFAVRNVLMHHSQKLSQAEVRDTNTFDNYRFMDHGHLFLERVISIVDWVSASLIGQSISYLP